MSLLKKLSNLWKNNRVLVVFFVGILTTLIFFLTVVLITRDGIPSRFDFISWLKVEVDTEESVPEEDVQPSPPSSFGEYLQDDGYRKVDVDIKFENEYSSLDVIVYKERIEKFVVEEGVLPGRNCFFRGRNEGECFENDKLRIKFSAQDVEDGDKINLGEDKALSYSEGEGEDGELLVVFNFSGLENLDAPLLSGLVNQGLVESLVYSTYDADRPESILLVRESAENIWQLMNDANDYFIEFN